MVLERTTIGVSGGGLTLGTYDTGAGIQCISGSSSPIEGVQRNSPVPGIKKPRLTGAGLAAYVFERASDYARRGWGVKVGYWGNSPCPTLISPDGVRKQ